MNKYLLAAAMFLLLFAFIYYLEYVNKVGCITTHEWRKHSNLFGSYIDSCNKYRNIKNCKDNYNYYGKKADLEYKLAYPCGNPAIFEKATEEKIDTICYPIKDIQ